jgi:hypothetical protein
MTIRESESVLDPMSCSGATEVVIANYDVADFRGVNTILPGDFPDITAKEADECRGSGGKKILAIAENDENSIAKTPV